MEGPIRTCGIQDVNYSQMNPYPNIHGTVCTQPFRHITISSILSIIQNRNPTRLTNLRKLYVMSCRARGSRVERRALEELRGDDEVSRAFGILIAEDISILGRLSKPGAVRHLSPPSM